MTERGMIFNGEMVRAILDGRKTQTRRIVKSQRVGDGWSVKEAQSPLTARHTHDWWLPTGTRPYSALPGCPYGVVGDRIWVREAWAEAGGSAPELKLYRANYPAHVPSHYENVPPAEDIRWTPSIHMPRWASRILLDITDVRVERLNGISDADCIAEGIIPVPKDRVDDHQFWRDYRLSGDGTFCVHTPRESFESLWKSIRGKSFDHEEDTGPGSWQANPWVWVIEFKRIEGDDHATD